MTYGHGTDLLDDIEAAAEVLGGDVLEQRAAAIEAERDAETAAVIERAAAVFHANIGWHLGEGITPEPVWMGFPAGDPDAAVEDVLRERGELLPTTPGALADLGDGVWLEFLDGERGMWSMQVAAQCPGCGGMRYLDASSLDRIGPAIEDLRRGGADVPCRECLPSETAPAWQRSHRFAAETLAAVPDRPGYVTLRDHAAVGELLALDPVVEASLTAVSVSVWGNRAQVSVNAVLDERADGVRPAARFAALLGLDEVPEVPEGEVQADEHGRWIDHTFTRTLSTAHGSVCVTVTGRELF